MRQNDLSTARKGEEGVTLVEMLIALALLGIILLGIAPLFLASVKSNYSAQEYTSIHNLARDRLEQLMTLPVTDPRLTGGACAGPAPSVNDLPTTLPDPVTGVPPSTVVNTLSRTYVVRHFRFPIVDITQPGAVPSGGVFQSTCVAPGNRYDFKRIDVTVESTSVTAPGLGSGYRTARVSGYLRNPDPVNNVL
jgi:prepilin-type N-terminal cleavage/methylation domain-containing protein